MFEPKGPGTCEVPRTPRLISKVKSQTPDVIRESQCHALLVRRGRKRGLDKRDVAFVRHGADA